MSTRLRPGWYAYAGIVLVVLLAGSTLGRARASVDNPTPRHVLVLEDVCRHPRTYNRLGIVAMPEACEGIAP